MFSQTQAQAIVDQALAPLRKEVEKARSEKDHPAMLDARRRLAMAKAIIAENARARNP
jgi:hypothetical protein